MADARTQNPARLDRKRFAANAANAANAVNAANAANAANVAYAAYATYAAHAAHAANAALLPKEPPTSVFSSLKKHRCRYSAVSLQLRILDSCFANHL